MDNNVKNVKNTSNIKGSNDKKAPEIKDTKKGFDRQWLIGLYDLIIYTAFFGFTMFLWGAEVTYEPWSLILHFALNAASLTVFRFIFKVYRQIWRYGGIQGYIRMLLSDFSGASVFYAVILILSFTPMKPRVLPFTFVLALNALTLLGSLTIRMCYRYAYKSYRREGHWGKAMRLSLRVFAGKNIFQDDSDYSHRIKVAIVGAGNVGAGLASELLGNKNSAYLPVCFIDNDAEKIGRQMVGLTVISEENSTLETLRNLQVQEVIFAMPRGDNEKMKALYDHYSKMGLKTKTYDFPTVKQAGSKRRHLREFDVEELLFRPALDVVDPKVSEFYKDKTVLITGGGGSIGSELCRQIAALSPKRLIILDVYENGAYDIQQELKQAYGNELTVCVEVLSVCNKSALEKVFATYHPQVVLHAAAHKHVPLMEHNCCEAIENNVFGTLNTVELSEKYGVERFMMVSTDKAVNPTNVMGATKRMCEMIVRCHSARQGRTTYSATRFGNVLGSAGSVIPLFKRQILKGGPITVTDKRIIRYFMTIPEASQLVLQSSAMAENGELFVLDMGKPVRILDLAENMIRLSGYVPYDDIDIIETGLRPGEKLYEELLVNTEELDKTENKLIFIERDEPISDSELEEKLEILRAAVRCGDDESAREALREAVPTFKTPEEVNAAAMNAKEVKMANLS